MNRFLRTMLFTVLIFIFNPGNSQSIHGVRAGIGHSTAYYKVKKLIFMDGHRFDPNQVFTPSKDELVIFLDHTWIIHPSITIGLSISHNSFEFRNNNASLNSQTAKFRQITGTFRTQYDWIKKRSLQLYSSVNLGMCSLKQYEIIAYGPNMIIDKSNHAKYMSLAMHLTPVGVTVGKKWGAFAELGLGFKGTLSAGVFMRFDE